MGRQMEGPVGCSPAPASLMITPSSLLGPGCLRYRQLPHGRLWVWKETIVNKSHPRWRRGRKTLSSSVWWIMSGVGDTVGERSPRRREGHGGGSWERWCFPSGRAASYTGQGWPGQGCLFMVTVMGSAERLGGETRQQLVSGEGAEPLVGFKRRL